MIIEIRTLDMVFKFNMSTAVYPIIFINVIYCLVSDISHAKNILQYEYFREASYVVKLRISDQPSATIAIIGSNTRGLIK